MEIPPQNDGPETGSASSNTTPVDLGEKAGDVVDRFELIDKVGEGGMGTVWRARQEQPVKREVALKIIKLGMDTREVVIRFEAERQALALMNHPFIAKVLDGGATDSGRPYFVMELVQGIPIADFCTQNKLGLRERIQLLIQVCEAVQHAHQKGVIHRDLKPSNVLVTERDGVPIPQVIDFGIAKATSAHLTESTLMTQHSQIIGTPEYMAPEQADMTSNDIDTRADVYSLGVMLYELLTGHPPFDLQAILEQGYMQLLRTIREQDPLRPSTRVTTSHGKPPRASQPLLDLKQLARHLRGDLDWIVMKALEKDRNRRYDTATSLALDLERHLNSEPVEAAPPSAAYRMRKFIHRRKRTVAAVLVIALLLVAGSIGTGWGWWEARQKGKELQTALSEKSKALVAETLARSDAEVQQNAAKAERDRAVRAEKQAIERAQELERVSQFQRKRLDVVDLPGMGAVIRNTLVQQAAEDQRPEIEQLLDGLNMVTVAFEVMRESIFGPTQVAIETEFKDDPVLQAFLLQHLARSMQGSGSALAAADAQERALALMRSEKQLGGDHELNSILMASTQAYQVGDLNQAEAHAREAYDLAYASGDVRPEATHKAESTLGSVLIYRGRHAEALLHLQKAHEIATVHFLRDDPQALAAQHNMALAMSKLGRAEEAEAIIQNIIQILEDCGEPCSFDRSIARTRLANIYAIAGRFPEATPILESSLEHLRTMVGDLHPVTLLTMRDLGTAYADQQMWSQASTILDKALEGFTELYGEDHVDVWLTRERIGRVLAGTGKRSQASRELQACYKALIRLLGPDQFHVEDVRSTWIKVLLDRGKFADAGPLLQLSLEYQIRCYGEDHPSVFVIRNNIGYSLEQQKKYADAEIAYRQAYEALQKQSGPRHRNTLTSLGNIGVMLFSQKKYEEAIPVLQESLRGKREVLGRSHPETLAVQWPLAQSMQGLGRFEEAIELWSQLKEEAERSEGVDSARKVTATLSLATCLKASGDLTTSQIEILDCWKSVREHLTEKHEYSMMVLNQVVQSYEIQNDFEGALPWLEKQLALREQMSVETHPYTVGCRANLGMGYQSVGRQQEALPLLEFAKNHAIETFGPTEETTIQVYLCYAEATRATGQPDAGSLALQDLIRALRKDGSVEDTWIAWAQVSLMAHLVSANQLDKAEAARDEALRLTADGWGDATWHGLELQSLTGVMHMQHGRFEEAERDLIIAADWMLTNDAMPKQADTISRGYPMIGIDRILELYEVWSAAKPELDHSVKVAQWTERRKNWLADPFR